MATATSSFQGWCSHFPALRGSRPCRPVGSAGSTQVSDVSSPFAWESVLTLERDPRCPFSAFFPDLQARVCQLAEDGQHRTAPAQGVSSVGIC